MDSQSAYDRVARCGLIAVMRGYFPPSVALDVTRTLMDAGGIDVFEFTLNSVEAMDAMKAVKLAYKDRALVGMGTVFDPDRAWQLITDGADFIVAPSFNQTVCEIVVSSDRLMIPGVITPTEAVDAWATGVKLLKLFPIGTLGIEYFRAIRAPLDHMAFMCNGGMSDANVAEFLQAGAVACGMAAWLTGNGMTPLETIARRARRLREIVDTARAGVAPD